MSLSEIKQELPDDMQGKCYIWSGGNCIEQCELLGYRCDTATCIERVGQLQDLPLTNNPTDEL